jgi:hypothetical protein
MLVVAGREPERNPHNVTQSMEPIIVRKNRQRAFWSLVIVLFCIPVSGWLVIIGLRPGRPDVSWALVAIGLVGLVAFGVSAVRVLRTMRAPWRLELTPSHLTLFTPTYDLEVPWDLIAGIAVDEVNRRPGCVLVFEDAASVASRATFHQAQTGRPDAVTDVQIMQARMEENFDRTGYHLAIPGRILEMGPDELAGILVKARTGELWQKEVE